MVGRACIAREFLPDFGRVFMGGVDTVEAGD